MRVPIRQWGLVTEGEYSYVGLPMGLWDSKAMPQTAKIPALLCLLCWGLCPTLFSKQIRGSQGLFCEGCLGARSRALGQCVWCSCSGEHMSLVKPACLARAGSKHPVLCWQDRRPQEAVMRNPGPVT